MGLPEIDIEFKSKAVTAVKRSAMGIVTLILKDDTAINVLTEPTRIYTSIDEVDASHWTPTNKDYIDKTFMGTPKKVIIEVLPTTATDYNEATKRAANKKWNYLAVPGISASDTTNIATWIKTERDSNKKTFKAVLPNTVADHEGVINFDTGGIEVGEYIYTASQYTSRIAGILAGLPFTRSATYYVLSEVDAITESLDPNGDIDAGKLILVNDGEDIKIGRGVNSLTTTTTEKSEDFKKIKILEVMDMVVDDIRDTYEKYYIGKVQNTYDNQVLFFTAINAYMKDLAGDEILDPNFDNKSFVNVEAQRLAWESIGTDTTDWDDQKVKEMSFKSKTFAAGRIKIVDAMEDLDFQIAI